jgi:hypothetical protein
MKQIAAVLTLVMVALVWLIETLLTPVGWYRLAITILSQPFRRFRGYAFDLWIASDQHLNAIFGGTPDTTISGRVGYHAQQGRPGYIVAECIIDAIFYIAVRQKGHCRASIEPDEIH